MGRRDRPLDLDAGPLHEFAAQLRALRESAGTPTYVRMARASGKSRTALAEAAGGDHLPTWPTVEAYVTACGGDVEQWRPRWEALRTAVRAPAVAKDVPAPAPDVPGEPDRVQPRTHRTGLLVLGSVVLAVAVAVPATLLVQDGLAEDPSAGPVQITVQNKVALGADVLAEDTTPSFLSSRPIASCGSLGCKLDGTEVVSGAVFVAVCQTTGDELVNYNVADPDPDAASNPGRVRSDHWYGVEVPNAGLGYIPDIYLTPASRGGLGLPAC